MWSYTGIGASELARFDELDTEFTRKLLEALATKLVS
jgi:hypothetical protein